MRKSIFFIGALDYPNVPQAGDAVKNRFLLDFFRKSFDGSVDYADTQKWKKNPLVLAKVMGCLLFRRYENIVISTSNVSAYRLVRLTTSMHLNSRIYYFMIGGYTPVKIRDGIYRPEPYRKLERIIVEADRVKELYKEVDIHNTYRLYNFKPVYMTPDVSTPHEGKVKFVFLSRLTRLKGIFKILEATAKLNAEGLQDQFVVDFYGRVDNDVHEEFVKGADAIANVSYKGFLKLDSASGYNTLSEYDAMLFPTMHPTEGFPGVIADAAICGLPVIASNWAYAEEIIGDGKCGILVPTGDADALADAMRRVVSDRSILQQMRVRSLERSALYDVSKVLSEELLTDLGMKSADCKKN